MNVQFSRLLELQELVLARIPILVKHLLSYYQIKY